MKNESTGAPTNSMSCVVIVRVRSSTTGSKPKRRFAEPKKKQRIGRGVLGDGEIGRKDGMPRRPRVEIEYCPQYPFIRKYVSRRGFGSLRTGALQVSGEMTDKPKVPP